MEVPLPRPVVPAKRPYEDDTREEGFSDDLPRGVSARITPSTSISLPPVTEAEDEDEDEPRKLYDSSGAWVGDLLPNCPWPLPTPNSVSVEVPETTLIFPESLYDGFVPPAPETSEGLAIDSLQRKLEELSAGPAQSEDDESQEFTLEDFSIYIDSKKKTSRFEMKPLQYLNAKASGHSEYYFDGVLRVGDEKYFLRKIPFRELPVGNYGPKNDSVDGEIWIRSLQNEKIGRQLYYKLGQPSKSYARYFENFTWISDFAKHFVDYLEECFGLNKSIRIHDFREAFFEATAARHHQSPAFKRWFGAYGKRDFGVPTSANAEFLYKEACGALSAETVDFHRIFREIKSFEEYKPVLADDSDPYPDSVPPTIVTPYTAHCFSNLPCSSVIQPLELDPKVEALRERVADSVSLELTRRAAQGLMPKVEETPSAAISSLMRDSMLQNIKPGDVISTPPDPDFLSKWARETPHGLPQGTEKWYGLVQTVEIQHRRRSFNILWLYHPVDTICCVMKYPIPNELFLSDHCTCKENIRIDQDEVLGVHPVAFWPALPEGTGLVCRQTYHVDDRRFTTYRESDRICICNSMYKAKPPVDEFTSKYRLGDAVLAKQNRQLEPFELVHIDAFSRKVTLRRLRRRQSFGGQGRPNEVVYTDQLIVRALDSVKRRCYVHVQMDGGKIPALYDRDGVGSLFFMTHFWDGDSQRCLPLSERDKPPILNQPPPGEKLLGLDLFCGVGNFGRGLEEGGAVDMRWANDISDKAIHAYMANADPSRVTPFLGSIDVLQQRAIKGRFGTGVPEVGLVGFLAGGSPCPGFSILTNDKTTPQQRKNQSLVAAFASMVDLYRPRYGILENVLGIVQNKASKREDVFCQLICALVGMGYQVQMLLLDAWSYGSCQSRSRVFLVFAAPGEELPKAPPHSHSHPPRTNNFGIGILTNREKMAKREFPDCPFEFRSAAAVTADLPDVYDTKTDYCICFPDHVASAAVTPRIRSQIKAIPHHPPEMNFSRAYYSGLMSPSDRKLFPDSPSARTRKGALGWGRIPGDKVFSTVVTTQSVTDCKAGPQLHWREERPMTLLEARRAQGFPDGEVLVGRVSDKWRAVGNSVPREVSLALGLTFMEAMFGRHQSGREVPRMGVRVPKGAPYPTPVSMSPMPTSGLGRGETTISNTTPIDEREDELVAEPVRRV